ncbi:MAG: exodeoxyribonuclease VII small subunit [Lachnospiraceae bacterium]|nr:exodeoxyribonuclease VII small subunit [Lachnospiraceae bacterium]MBQ5484740.1 exodeoxyribonuclease VII small subunit [Lachnospiraceae bacterium]MCR4732861.1 exodeoxyribonuclease VII small subunit [Lachnospiraceae bacterium]
MANKKDLTIEERFEQLEAIAEQMEDPKVGLEDSFSLYEQGMKLLKETSERIEAVAGRVEKLEADGSLSDFEEEA